MFLVIKELFLFLTLVELLLNREISGLIRKEEEEASSGDLVEEEKSEDCKANQFYYEPRGSCRNCSELNQLFHSYSEWLGHEVSSVGGDALKTAVVTTTTTTTTSSGNNKYDKSVISALNARLSAASNLAKEGTSKFGANGEVLSRLISAANPQDQEYLEPTQDSGSNEYDSDLLSDNIKQATKQTEKLVARFIRSKSIENELLGAIEQCRQFQNVTACQMWSNICVLSMYSYSDSSMQKGLEVPPSSNFKSTISYMKGNNPQGDNISWQQCSQFTLTSICNGLREWSQLEKKSSLEVSNIYAVDELLLSKVVGGGFGLLVRLNQAIQLLAYKYFYDGKFIGVDQFGLDEMEKFCIVSRDLKSRSLDINHIRLGRNMQLKCLFNSIQAASTKLAKLHNDTVFIDLYIGYQLNGALFLKPVPILIKNLLYNGYLINRKYANDPSRWKLVHRFFFHTKYTVESDSTQSPDTSSSVLLFAKDVTLDLTFKRQDKGTLLSSILLTIDYDQTSLSSSLSSNHAGDSNHTNRSFLSDNFSTEVRIIQTLQDMQSYKKDLDLTLTVLGIMSSIWSLLKCYNIQKCYGIFKLDLNFLMKFILISCDTLGSLLALITFSFMTLLFTALKFQSSVHVLEPTEELDSVVIFNLQLAFLFKLIGIIYKFYIILNADIFFIDWEKPKMLTSGELFNHLTQYNKLNKERSDQLKVLPDKKELSVANQTSTFWRPYTVVNRWIQMLTLRRHNTTLQLLLFACVIQFTEMVDYSKIEGDFIYHQSLSHTHSHHQKTNYQLVPTSSLTFKLLIIFAIYLVLSVVQILFKRLFYESIVKDTLHEFIDLCSVANVSLFCMLYPRFGYYIHGRNANGFGDCGIAEINALLEREERDLCSKRGLESNCDQQAFVLILPRIINDHYRKILFRDDLLQSLNDSNKKQQFNNTNANGSNLFSGNNLIRSALNLPFSPSATSSFSLGRAAIESIVAKNKMINAFLTNFISHIYKDIDYSIKDRRRFESFLSDINFDDEESSVAAAARSGPLIVGAGTGAGSLNTHHQLRSITLATFCKDPTNSFTSLLWLGYEWDLILVELLSLLMLELWLNQPLIITVSLIWLLYHSVRKLYISLSRHNLIAKALLDQKFVLR